MTIGELTSYQKQNAYYTGVQLGRDVRTQTDVINNSTQKLIATQLAATSSIVASQDRISSGIDNVSIGIDRVAEGIAGLQATFEWGISQVVWQLEQNREVLKSILEVLSAPLDTQAKELRKRAEDAYANGWIDDALEDFLESEKKNKYDFSIHISLGNIFFFCKNNKEEALAYYEKAIKYAKPKSSYHASYALLHKGLIRFNDNLVEEAEECTSEAITLSTSFAEAYYQNAQYNSVLSNTKKCLDNLEKAILLDKYYCLKASNDKLFTPINNELEKLFSNLRHNEIKYCKKVLGESIEIFDGIKSIICEANNSIRPEFTKNSFQKEYDMSFQKKITEIENFMSRNSYFDAIDAKEKVDNLLSKIREYHNGARNYLEKVRYKIGNEILSKNKIINDKLLDSKKTLSVSVVFIGSLFSVILGFKGCHSNFFNEERLHNVESLGDWFSGFISTLIGSPLILIVTIFVGVKLSQILGELIADKVIKKSGNSQRTIKQLSIENSKIADCEERCKKIYKVN